MKHGKRPSVAQKIYIASFRLNAANWLVVMDCKDKMVIQHRLSGKTRELPGRER